MSGPATARRRAAGGRRGAALLALALAACGSSRPGAPHPTSITPDGGPQVVPVAVRIRGEGFGAQVSADLSGGGGVVDARFQALLGDTPLDDVALQQDGSIAATVPAGMAAGLHDLTVVGPDGRSGRLAGAYRVVAPGATARRVAAYRFDAVGPQVARSPFTVTVTAVDAAGEVVSDFTGTASLSDLGGTAVPASVGLFAAGRWTGLVELRGPHAADVLTMSDAGGATGSSAAFAVRPAPAALVRLDAGGAAVTAGECAGPITLSLLDAFGQPTTAEADTTLALAALPAAGFALHADPACGAPVSSPVVAAGQGSVAVWFTATTAGALQLTASGTALPPVARTWSVAAGLPAALVFLSDPLRAVAGVCSGAATVEVRDAFGNLSDGGVPALALAASPSTDFELFSDACGTPAVSLAVVAGATTATFHFRGTAAGVVTVGVSAAGLAGASQDEAIDPAAATSLAFATDPRAARAGACSAGLTVEARDPWGNAVAGVADVPVALSAAPGGDFAFHADAACGGATPAVAIPAGDSRATFFFRGTASGDVAVTAASPGLSAANQTARVDPGLPAAVIFSTPARTVEVRACSAAVGLAVLDAFGNASPVEAPLSVGIGASPPGGFGLFADGGCTIPLAAVTVPAGSDAALFHFSAPDVGSLVVTATPAGLTGATQTESVVAAASQRLAFTTDPQIVQAGSCSAPVTVEAQDAYGNPTVVSTTAATPVTLSGADLAFFQGAGCTGGAVTFAAGATTATFSFRRSVPGTGTVEVTASAGMLAGAQTETIVAGPASGLVFTTGPQTVQAGACSGDVTVESQDAAGNPSSVPAATPVNLTGAGLTFHAGGGCGGGAVTEVSIPSGGTSVTFSFRGTTAGPASITAAAAGFASAIQGQTIEPGPLHHLTWAAIASPQGAGAPFGVTVTARDAAENLVAYGGTATLTASAGTVSCTTSCTSASVTAAFGAGTWSGTVTVPSAAASVTLTATAAAGPSGTSNAFDVEGTWAPRSPPFARFTAAPRLIVSGNPIGFDPGASSDRQTAAGALTMSWDWDAQGAASYAQPAAPPAAPWTPWETLAPTTHTYINNSGVAQVYRPRLAVRDTEGGGGGPDVGYAGGLVVVLPNGNDFCVVNTSSLADDGATGCYGPGPDGRLSLAEAVRLANGWAGTLNITFSDPMTITSTATVSSLTLSRAARLIGIPGVVLNGVSLTAAADDVLVAGLEFRNLSTPITVRSQVASDARLEDLVVHDGAGVLVQGRGLLNRLTMYGCAGACVRQTGTSDLALWSSDLHGAGAGTGVAMEGCGSGTYSQAMESPYFAWTTNGWQTTGSAAVFSTVLTGFATGIDIGPHGACAEPYLSNLTFDGNGTGVRRDASAGGGGLLLDSVFTGQTAAAVDPAACGFFIVARSATYGNASLGCLTPDLTADPLYVWRAGRDFRIQYASPLKDQANPVNVIELDDAGPGLYLGANPDRGGRETY